MDMGALLPIIASPLKCKLDASSSTALITNRKFGAIIQRTSNYLVVAAHSKYIRYSKFVWQIVY
jgi:hypothetical protein